jgi:hypothetical protein
MDLAMEAKQLNIIITGTSGMVGEGVLHECINSPFIKNILIINRKALSINNPKVKELILTDFLNVSSIENQLIGYDACFFCMGSTSLGKSKDEYYKVSYSIPIMFGEVISKINPSMIFEYISGAGTDSSENGKIMWARVKGKTENDLMKLPFKRVFVFRPGYLHPTKGLNNTQAFYKYISWLYPTMRKLMPNQFTTLSELGQAMINSVIFPYSRQIIEIKDIIKLSKLSNEK